MVEYYVGQKVVIEKQVTKENVQMFAEVSGDYNPLHLDEEYAKKSRFGQCIAHGILGGAYISSVLGTEFPGVGTIYLEQNLKFLKPIYIGKNIRILVEIINIDEKKRAELMTEVVDENGDLIISGRAKVILPN